MDIATGMKQPRQRSACARCVDTDQAVDLAALRGRSHPAQDHRVVQRDGRSIESFDGVWLTFRTSRRRYLAI